MPTQDSEGVEESESADQPAGSLELPSKTRGENENPKPPWADIPDRDIELMVSDRAAFGLHLRDGGEEVSDEGVTLGFLASFSEYFKKVFDPLKVLGTGTIPLGNRLPTVNAASLRVLELRPTGSITIIFGLGDEETAQVGDRFDDFSQLLTMQATGYLGHLLSLDPKVSDPVSAVEPFGRRIGRSYAQFAELLADKGVALDWWSPHFEDGEASLSVLESREISEELLGRPIPEEEEFEIGGFMWEAATRTDRRVVRISTPNQGISATYDIPLTSQVTAALSHVVRVKLLRTEFRYPFAEKPHKRTWKLLEILEVGSPGGALAAEEDEAAEE